MLYARGTVSKTKMATGRRTSKGSIQSCPFTVAASEVADFYSLLTGYSGEQSDAEMACTQAHFDGPEIWVGLPREPWPAKWLSNG